MGGVLPYEGGWDGVGGVSCHVREGNRMGWGVSGC